MTYYWNAIFEQWREAQQQFLDNLPMKLPGLEAQKQSISPWESPHLQTFLSWGQSAVKQSMELQTNWLEQWVGQMDSTISVSNESKSDMIQRIQESMSGWSENQSELWEYWFNMVEQTSGSIEDSAALAENIASWKSTVEESLCSQTDWLEEWPEKINIEELTPEELLNVSSRIQETMNGWLELQGELWNQWFDFLSLNEAATITVARPKPAKNKPVRKKVTVKKKVQKKSVTTTEKNIKDNLEMISGIGPALAKKLYDQGIISFKQIAALTEKEIDTLEKTIIKFPGRIHRENWVEQAVKFLKEPLNKS